jgi:phage terminase small subunit
MGRTRISTKQKLLNGTLNATDDAGRNDQYFPCITDNAIIEAPVNLSDRSKAIWYSTTQTLIALGVLHEIDLPYLEEGFRILDEIAVLDVEIAQLMSKKKKREDDYKRWFKLSTQRRNDLHTYLECFSRFGVTPSERTKILFARLNPDNNKKEDNPILAVLAEDSND